MSYLQACPNVFSTSRLLALRLSCELLFLSGQFEQRQLFDLLPVHRFLVDRRLRLTALTLTSWRSSLCSQSVLELLSEPVDLELSVAPRLLLLGRKLCRGLRGPGCIRLDVSLFLLRESPCLALPQQGQEFGLVVDVFDIIGLLLILRWRTRRRLE